MEMNYIFLLKENSGVILDKTKAHYIILENLSSDVTMDSLVVDYNEEKYSLKYSIYYDDKVDMFKLAISLNKSLGKSAKVLNYVDSLLRKGKIRKDYNIIVTYDGVSNYFCDKSYPLLNEFERRLRELVYIILIKTFGAEWYEKTVSDELKIKIKETSKCNNKTVLIESALYEITMYDMEKYLFNPYCEYNSNDIIQSIIDDGNKSKEDIVNLLSACTPKSLWDRFFYDKINNIQAEINETRIFRNKIAHNKEFHAKEFNRFKKIIKVIIDNIKVAIEDINNTELSRQIKRESYFAYSTLFNSELQDAMKNIAKQSELMQKTLGLGTQSAMKGLMGQLMLARKDFCSSGLQDAMKGIVKHSELMQKTLGLGTQSAMKELMGQSMLARKALCNTGLQDAMKGIVKKSELIQKTLGLGTQTGMRGLMGQSMLVRKAICSARIQEKIMNDSSFIKQSVVSKD
ncbi:hypothetical protein E4V42_03790 [Clostridium estertheticum]|uniref:Uncharacterized protein n=1 Tax=Clostridium estertheticum TaxID=238834 RepID=A0A5N7IJS9_9CLOT|nr:hypothetical protein [Clostridium estertheticum]MPQ30558.1 hypothetical protein [Clostridium estertheticum]MPQ61234.1 hypothetical protein [Clostridium estertheticum]